MSKTVSTTAAPIALGGATPIFRVQSLAASIDYYDPDGNVLRFGSGPKEDEPVDEWVDMHGRSWTQIARRRMDAGCTSWKNR